LYGGGEKIWKDTLNKKVKFTTDKKGSEEPEKVLVTASISRSSSRNDLRFVRENAPKEQPGTTDHNFRGGEAGH